MKKSEVETIASNITKSFKGIEIKGTLPKVGGGWSYGVGSDSYGGTILYVSPDLSWFIGDDMCGFAKFDTRKNSCHFGKYVHATWKELGQQAEYHVQNLIKHPEIFNVDGAYKKVFKDLKYEKTCHSRGCLSHNVRWVSETPQTTYLDPSF